MSAIPSNKLLDKISELAVKAKSAKTKDQQLGCILAIKALCELMEQEAVGIDALPTVASPESVEEVVHNSEQKIIFEDANGSSLLDF